MCCFIVEKSLIEINSDLNIYKDLLSVMMLSFISIHYNVITL